MKKKRIKKNNVVGNEFVCVRFGASLPTSFVVFDFKLRLRNCKKVSKAITLFIFYYETEFDYNI